MLTLSKKDSSPSLHELYKGGSHSSLRESLKKGSNSTESELSKKNLKSSIDTKKSVIRTILSHKRSFSDMRYNQFPGEKAFSSTKLSVELLKTILKETPSGTTIASLGGPIISDGDSMTPLDSVMKQHGDLDMQYIDLSWLNSEFFNSWFIENQDDNAHSNNILVDPLNSCYTQEDFAAAAEYIRNFDFDRQ